MSLSELLWPAEECNMIKTVLKIDGMSCGMCESHINDVIRREFKVKKVSSSHKKGETVIISDDSMDYSKLKNEINKTGYDILEITEEPYEKKRLFGK